MLTPARRTVAVDLPHLAFATAIAGWCAWLCFDAWRAHASVENLIMIAPASLGAVILYGFIASSCLRVVSGPDQTRRRQLGRAEAIKVAGSMALLTAYVVAAPAIGFDVSSFAFLFAMLLLLGERRILVLLLAPALFCAIAIYCFAAILDTPLPLFFFGGDAS